MLYKAGYFSCLTKVSSSDEECLSVSKLQQDRFCLGNPQVMWTWPSIFRLSLWLIRCILNKLAAENALFHGHYRGREPSEACQTDPLALQDKYRHYDQVPLRSLCRSKRMWRQVLSVSLLLLVSKCKVFSSYILWIKNGKAKRSWRHTAATASSVRK